MLSRCLELTVAAVTMPKIVNMVACKRIHVHTIWTRSKRATPKERKVCQPCADWLVVEKLADILEHRGGCAESTMQLFLCAGLIAQLNASMPAMESCVFGVGKSMCSSVLRGRNLCCRRRTLSRVSPHPGLAERQLCSRSCHRSHGPAATSR